MIRPSEVNILVYASQKVCQLARHRNLVEMGRIPSRYSLSCQRLGGGIRPKNRKTNMASLFKGMVI